jgi:hypothetical protein
VVPRQCGNTTGAETSLTSPGDPSAKPFELASGEIVQDARISVELIPGVDSATCVIVWPRKPTPVSPAKLAGCVAATCRVLSNAVLELAARRGRKGW